MIKKVLPTLLFSALFLSAGTRTYDTNAKIKAVFLYNFTKYIEWPKEERSGKFVFGVLGNSPLYTELSNMSKTKKVNGSPIEVKKFNSPNEINGCHVIYVPPASSGKWTEVLKKVSGKSTLLVSEKPGLAKQGAIINFVVKDNRQKFELNLSNAQKHELKVSSSLEALAIVVK